MSSQTYSFVQYLLHIMGVTCLVLWFVSNGGTASLNQVYLLFLGFSCLLTTIYVFFYYKNAGTLLATLTYLQPKGEITLTNPYNHLELYLTSHAGLLPLNKWQDQVDIEISGLTHQKVSFYKRYWLKTFNINLIKYPLNNEVERQTVYLSQPGNYHIKATAVGSHFAAWKLDVVLRKNN